MNNEGWKRAAIAWEVCASIHREYAKGKDALFTTRQKDFVNAANKARVKAQAPTPPMQQDDEALEVLRDVMTWVDNWHCQFKDDENWLETEDRARALLEKRGAA